MGPEIQAAKRRVLLIAVLLVVLILAAFEPIRHNGFVLFDDPTYITKNPNIRSGITAQSAGWALTSGYAGNWHPLTWLSHMLDIELFGLTPLGHHLHNLGLHLAATVLLFWVLRSMTGTLWRSAFVALAFGLHPLHVESVAWAAERKDLLCAVFWMLTCVAYLSYTQRGGIPRYLLVVLCFALGLMAKPMIVTLPVVLLALDIWPLRRLSMISQGGLSTADAASGRELTRRIGLILEKVPLFALTLASCVVTVLVQKKAGAVAGLNLKLGYRVSNALVSYVAYLGKIAWPAHLAIIYPLPPYGWPLWKPVVCSLLLVLVSAFVLYQARRRPYLLVGWAWYLVTLIPVIGLVQVGDQAMADRYGYLPSVGIFIMLSWGAAELPIPGRPRRIVFAALSVLLGLGMLAGTHAQVSYWKDGVSLYRHALSVTRDNYLVCDLLATVLGGQGQLDEAEELYRETLRIHPGIAEAHMYLGRILESRGQYADALQRYEQAMQLDAQDWRAFCEAGTLQARQGRLVEAEDLLRQSLRLNNDRHKASLHLNLGQVLTAEKNYPDAIESYERAIELDPADFRPLYYAGTAKMEERAWSEAADYLRRSIGLNAGYAEAYFGLATALRQQGKTEEAVAVLREGLRLKPDSVSCLNDLAWILATAKEERVRNPSEAVRLAEKACELTSFRDCDCLDTLGAAYAAASQFDKAIETAQKAMALARAANQADAVQDVAKKLQLYQAGQAYVEP